MRLNKRPHYLNLYVLILHHLTYITFAICFILLAPCNVKNPQNKIFKFHSVIPRTSTKIPLHKARTALAAGRVQQLTFSLERSRRAAWPYNAFTCCTWHGTWPAREHVTWHVTRARTRDDTKVTFCTPKFPLLWGPVRLVKGKEQRVDNVWFSLYFRKRAQLQHSVSVRLTKF